MFRFRVLIFLALLPVMSMAQMDDPEADADAVQVLINAGEFQNAIARVEAALKKHRKHERLLLQRGLILVQLDRLKEAESHYKRLKRRFDDNPEPGNNLAMVYRYSGDYEKAIEEFESTIKQFPHYAQAHENLGDTYIEMAGSAYATGREQIPDSAILASKQDITARFDAIALGNTPAARRQALTQLETPTADSEAPVPDDGEHSNAGNDGSGSLGEPVDTGDTPLATIQEQILATLNSWITTWSEKDVVNHLAHYSQQFDPGNGKFLAQWIGEKRDEISTAQYIVINLTEIRISQTAANLVTVTFQESYESDSRAERVLKSLTLGHGSGEWLILKEESRPLG